MAGTFTITGMAAGLASGEKIIGPISATGNALIGQITDVALSSGDNTFAIPTGAVAALIIFPQAMTQTVKLRTGSDTGGCIVGPQSAANFVLLPLATGVSSLIINASGAVTLTTEINYI